MPSKKVASDSDFELDNCSQIQESSQHYNTITYETRLRLIQMVLQEKISVIKAAKQLEIKLSTAKFIINSFKKKGKVMKRKSEMKKQKLDQVKVSNKINQKSQQKPTNIKQEEEISSEQKSQSSKNISAPIFMNPEMFYFINYNGLIPWQMAFPNNFL